jgi:hypothetical protein
VANFAIGQITWIDDLARMPLGWHVCDGGMGTLNLKNLFIPGAGGAYAVGQTGGGIVSAAHTHGLGGVHIISGNHSHVTHLSSSTGVGTGSNLPGAFNQVVDGPTGHSHGGTGVSGDSVHVHPLSGTVGSSGPGGSLPVYTALYPIQRIF